MKKRTFVKEEKLKILDEPKKKGVQPRFCNNSGLNNN